MAMGGTHENNALTEDNLVRIDIMLRPARIAVEIQGLTSFTANTRQPLGKYRSRHCLGKLPENIARHEAGASVRSSFCCWPQGNAELLCEESFEVSSRNEMRMSKDQGLIT